MVKLLEAIAAHMRRKPKPTITDIIALNVEGYYKSLDHVVQFDGTLTLADKSGSTPRRMLISQTEHELNLLKRGIFFGELYFPSSDTTHKLMGAYFNIEADSRSSEVFELYEIPPLAQVPANEEDKVPKQIINGMMVTEGMKEYFEIKTHNISNTSVNPPNLELRAELDYLNENCANRFLLEREGGKQWKGEMYHNTPGSPSFILPSKDPLHVLKLEEKEHLRKYLP
jgi:hypothetical protein